MSLFFHKKSVNKNCCISVLSSVFIAFIQLWVNLRSMEFRWLQPKHLSQKRYSILFHYLSFCVFLHFFVYGYQRSDVPLGEHDTKSS